MCEQNICFLDKCNISLIMESSQVVLAMEMRSFPPLEIIFPLGTSLNEMYVVKRGIVVGRGRIFTRGKVRKIFGSPNRHIGNSFSPHFVQFLYL